MPPSSLDTAAMNRRRKLLVKLKTRPHELSRILLSSKPVIRGRSQDVAVFEMNPTAVRDLSPIRGAIRTPAASLAHAPVLNDQALRRAQLPSSSSFELSLPNNTTIPTKHDAASLVTGRARDSSNPQSKQNMATRCEGCRTKESVTVGCWILNAPSTDNPRENSLLDLVCTHKLRRTHTMATAMLNNAQRECSRLEEEYFDLQARYFQLSPSAAPSTPQPSELGANPSSGATLPPQSPMLPPDATPDQQVMLQLAAQAKEPNPHDVKAREDHKRIFKTLKERVPGFPDDDLKRILQDIFNAGRTHANNTRAQAVYDEGVRVGRNKGILEGWEACERALRSGVTAEVAEDDLRVVIGETCHKRDAVVREAALLQKKIEVIKRMVSKLPHSGLGHSTCM